MDWLNVYIENYVNDGRSTVLALKVKSIIVRSIPPNLKQLVDGINKTELRLRPHVLAIFAFAPFVHT